MDRRTFLLSLAAVPVIAQWPGSLLAAGNSSTQFLHVSRVITGADNLTADVAARIELLLSQRDGQFLQRLSALYEVLNNALPRDQALAQLPDEHLSTALMIAKPWYLGYVGDPTGGVLDSDAEFATYLEMQAFAKTDHIVPAPSYPPGRAGWWQAVPKGVDASDLPADIISWSYQPLAHYHIAEPDPAWLAYAAGEFDSIDAARIALGKEA